MKVLITGGTVFVSKYTATYFVEKGFDVYVLNRGSRPQIDGVTLIEADRHDAHGKLAGMEFDAVIDVTAYNGSDIEDILDASFAFKTYVMISSSAVYPEYEEQPFVETAKLAENRFWGKYGTDKIDAEKALLCRVPDAYILRPPYLYGPMNNVYREAFVFDCAMQDRKFYLPGNGDMKMQFLHVRDLCRIIETIIENCPVDHIINVGNEELVSIKEWVELCYASVGKKPEFVSVPKDIEQRLYFSFYDYEYSLDVSRQSKLLGETIGLRNGLRESYEWYRGHSDEVRRKPLIDYIDNELV